MAPENKRQNFKKTGGGSLGPSSGMLNNQRGAAGLRGKNHQMQQMEAALAFMQEESERYSRRVRKIVFTSLAILLLAAAAGYGAGQWHAAEEKRMAEMARQQALQAAAAKIAAAQPKGPQGIQLVPSSDPTILKLQRTAASGDARAQYDLAQRYEVGRGVAADKALALSLLQNAAAAGHAPAMLDLGSSYISGRFGQIDRHAAVRWLEAAAATGNAIAAFKLGELYEGGLDGAPDTAMALGWYQRAAGFGSDPALVAIARLTPKKPPITTDDVRRIQLALRHLGYNIGVADGKMGARTVDSIKAYQSQIGMMADGRPSHFLLERLEEDRVMQGG